MSSHPTRRTAGRFRTALLITSAIGGLALQAAPAAAFTFTPGDLVVSVYGDGDGSGTYDDNLASPITLDEYAVNGTSSGTLAGTLVLPQTQTVVNGVTNYAISGEFGSSSEGALELSGNGQYLTIAGYGVNAATYNANPASYGGTTKSCIGAAGGSCFPLAQTSSVPGFATSAAATTAGDTSATVTAVPRVIALIGANGNVDTSTGLLNVFNENNPRSVTTANGSSFYISGQGISGDTTGGVFYAQKGASAATPITTTYDTRYVSIQNNTLYASQDSSEGTGQLAYVSQLGTSGTLPTSATTPAPLPGIVTGSKKSASPGEVSLSSANGGNGNSINGSSGMIYLSPEQYFYANANTLYVTDSGNPKAGGVGDGGLQKWSLIKGNWVLDYTLSAGLLNLVPSTTSCGANQIGCGTTGLIGLAGEVVGNEVELFATNSTLGDLDQTYLYGITDDLSDTMASQVTSEDFSVIATAAPDTDIRGVSLAPAPEPTSFAILGTGLVGGLLARRKRKAA